jgi:hypothetical protein
MAAWGLKVFGISAEESGERQAFHATSSRYPSKIMIEARVEKVEASEFYEVLSSGKWGVSTELGWGRRFRRQSARTVQEGRIAGKDLGSYR